MSADVEPAPPAAPSASPAGPQFSRQDLRELNRRMASTILGAEPDPYVEGGYARRVAQVRGRRSGAERLVPIAVVSVDGHRYLVSPTHDRNWVRNLLADPTCVIRSRDDAEPCTATPVSDLREAADVALRYARLMHVAPWAIAQFPFPPDADLAQVEAIADRLAVFRLEARA